MSFVARELDRISARLHERDISPAQYEQLYAAQQALSWALDPNGFAPPYIVILGIQEGLEDCLARSRPPSSSDTFFGHEPQSRPMQNDH